MRLHPTILSRFVLALGLISLVGVGCERPPMETRQDNFRGLGTEEVRNPRIHADKVKANQVPEPMPPVEPAGTKASEVYENVEVLGDLDVAEFGRLMGAITQWVSPEQGCTYCHEGAFANEGIYTKTVSRRMLQMTRDINTQWDSHIGEQGGVTCYTCHRGQPVPAYVWVQVPESEANPSAGQNLAASRVGLTSLPYDPFARYMSDGAEIRVQGDTALPTGNRNSIKQTEATYGLMIHLSTSLGVNCTYCHNSRAFSPWEESSPKRVNAWHAIRMVRGLNEEYITPLADVFPANRKGPLGDPYKINCTTCHQGVAKPLLGVNMAADYPSLTQPNPGARMSSAHMPPEAHAFLWEALESPEETRATGERPSAGGP